MSEGHQHSMAPDAARRTTDAARQDRPDQAAIGLLNYITATSMDEDYAHVARRTAKTEEKTRLRARTGATFVLALFGVLLAVAAVQTSRDAPDSANNRDYLVGRINAAKADLSDRRRQIIRLQKEVTDLGQKNLSATATGRALQSRLDLLGVMSGVAPVTGPGIRVAVDDSPVASTDAERVLDKDLQHLVNGLWEVGAEAIAINGQRLTTLSAIRQAGGAITVNFRNVPAPYVISAVGDPNTLASDFVDTDGAQRFALNQSRYGLEFSINSVEGSLSLPPASRSTLRYAVPARPDRKQAAQ